MPLYMFRALNAHLQEDTLYTCSIWYSHSVNSLWWPVSAPTGHHELSQRVTVPYVACIQCILLKMSI